MVFYTSTFLKRITSSLPSNSRLAANVWNSLISCGISRTKPTRRGCRAGRYKTKSSIDSPYILPSLDAQKDQTEAVKQANLEEKFQPKLNIQVLVNKRSPMGPHLKKRLCRNHNNLITINCKEPTPPKTNAEMKKSLLPSFFLLNARSLFPKLDELSALLSTIQIDLVAVTESWFRNDMDDSLLTISGYNIFRKDRADGRGGGVCVFLNDDISSQRRLDLERPDLECLWLTVRPRRLPRPLSAIAICVVYHPPGLPVERHKNLSDFLITTTDYLRNNHPDHGLVFLGDFNDFDTNIFARNHSLKQVVKVPTRNSAILDLIITNMQNLYENPSALAPLGSSDHNIVHWRPRTVIKEPSHDKPMKRQVRRYPQSGMDALGRWLSTHNWFGDLDSNASVDDLTTSFTIQLTDAIDRIFPVKSIKIHKTDKPWMTPQIKLLINDRQKAFHSGNNVAWRSLKYKVQQVITNTKRSYYKNKVKHLKQEDCRKWWGAINQMSGRTASASEFVLEKDGKTIRGKELANNLNIFYTSVNADIPPLDMNTLPAFLPAFDDTITIQPHEVCKKLLAVKPNKAHGPDNIPCRIVKEFAYELAEPVTNIFNKSLQSCLVPASWKESNIIPIPKVPSPNEESDTRPISLSDCLSVKNIRGLCCQMAS